mmetsp:Transcript_80653/g.159763  ORF Transcript_80653/g.159763 Transcript_80653/m.159763 type:complete len:179 (+) Transcript_80653:254-790(+)|eukprot:CAMPEP_0172736188 /NCGR_PEP_ID=MMETSP1074-20121228/114444_1 /TAXON_ID=2916 /ORGANISM="Ceratium fusus, Strain PA161109" /LENGTH=178 /DNA_ID=CAMNT_0013565351 /DNA_START=301 /DNA_END=837 /DNA_ORIENTATION=+
MSPRACKRRAYSSSKIAATSSSCGNGASESCKGNGASLEAEAPTCDPCCRATSGQSQQCPLFGQRIMRGQQVMQRAMKHAVCRIMVDSDTSVTMLSQTAKEAFEAAVVRPSSAVQQRLWLMEQNCRVSLAPIPLALNIIRTSLPSTADDTDVPNAYNEIFPCLHRGGIIGIAQQRRII